jgi:hypothetical protein
MNQRLRDGDLFSADLGPVTFLHVPDHGDHEIHLFMRQGEPFLSEVIHLQLRVVGDIPVHSADTWIAGMDSLSACDLADGLADFPDPLDPFRD